MGKGIFTKDEIFNQTNAWNGALREVQAHKKEILDIDFTEFRQVIFTGCGSTYYLSQAAAALFQTQTGTICKAVPGGELLMNPNAIFSGNNNLLVAISRSGSTSETVKAVKEFKNKNGGKVISISNYDNQPLTESSDLALCIKEGQEQSVAQTKSFNSMLITATALAMLASGRQDLYDTMQKLPDIGQGLIEKYQNFAKEKGENLGFDRFYFLGSGTRYGLACEANLKMKEMTLTHSEPFHFLEFRHGPMSMVNENTVISGLLSQTHREYEQKVLEEMKDKGAKVISLAETDADIVFNSGLPENIQNVLYMPALQIMAYYRSIAKGLDPDNPKNLSSVVYLD